jgi:hypothetical protein
MKYLLFILLLVAVLITAGCTSEPQTPKDKIDFRSQHTVRTNILDSTKTYTVIGTFTNTGSTPYTFWGGFSIFDEHYNDLGFKGETMTLNPGESKTIVETFVVDISWNFKGVVDRET